MSTNNDNLYRFVKASERLPGDKKDEKGGWIKSANGFYFCNCEDDVVDVCQFKTSWGEFRHIYTDPYREEKANVISWLEKIEADQQEDKTLNKIKKELAVYEELEDPSVGDLITFINRIKKIIPKQ